MGEDICRLAVGCEGLRKEKASPIDDAFGRIQSLQIVMTMGLLKLKISPRCLGRGPMFSKPGLRYAERQDMLNAVEINDILSVRSEKIQ